jgi:magnesium transporter
MDVLTAVAGDRIAGLLGKHEYFWLDLESPSEAELDALQAALSLHPMALEDTRELGQRPKVDVYDTYVLVVFFTVRETDDPDRVVETVEVHVYVSGDWILTVRSGRVSALERLHHALAPTGTHEENYLVYRIFDGLTDAFFPAIAAIEERIDALEGEVLERPRRELLRGAYRRKQEVHELQRLVTEQRDQFMAASDSILQLAGLSRGTQEYLRDIGDHLAQLRSELQRQNDDLTALAGLYFSASAERVSRTATRLSLVATFFVVWTLVTGFFGQNFQWLVDSVESRTDFLVFGVGGLVVPTVGLALLLWVKRRDWF